MASKLTQEQLLAKIAKKLPAQLSLDTFTQIPFEITAYTLADIIAAKTAVSTDQAPINWGSVTALMLEFANGKPLINPPELAILHDQLYLVGGRHRIQAYNALCEKYDLDPDEFLLDCRLYRVNSGAEITRLIFASNEARKMSRPESSALNISSATDFVDITDPNHYAEALKNVWYRGDKVASLKAGLFTKAAQLAEKTWDSVPLVGETPIDSDYLQTRITALTLQSIATTLANNLAKTNKANVFGKAVISQLSDFDNLVTAVDIIIGCIDDAVNSYCQNPRRATNIARDGARVIAAEAEMLLRSAFPDSWFASTVPTKALAPKRGNAAINDAVAAKF